MRKLLFLVIAGTLTLFNFTSCTKNESIEPIIEDSFALSAQELVMVKEMQPLKSSIVHAQCTSIKDKDGNIEAYKIRTIAYLPKNSEPSVLGLGKGSNYYEYRPIRINASGTSTEFDYFGVNFVIDRDDVGLLERGVNVKVKFNGVSVTRSSNAMATLSDPQGDQGGLTVEYEDEDLP